jgi:hypothetical protein
MRRTRRFWGFSAVITVAAALTLLTTFASAAPSGGAQHVRWDIISIPGGTPGPGAQVNPGGHASATAPNGDTITLTGSGHFVAPASGGGSGAADGGGTYTTSGGESGSYTVTALVSWENAGAQANIGLVDNIDEGTATNGTAVLKIAFSDGKQGVLTVGCHGPGAPPGIFEGIATTKGYKTYYTVPTPVAGVDAGRTIFHVR